MTSNAKAKNVNSVEEVRTFVGDESYAKLTPESAEADNWCLFRVPEWDEKNYSIAGATPGLKHQDGATRRVHRELSTAPSP